MVQKWYRNGIEMVQKSLIRYTQQEHSPSSREANEHTYTENSQQPILIWSCYNTIRWGVNRLSIRPLETARRVYKGQTEMETVSLSQQARRTPRVEVLDTKCMNIEDTLIKVKGCQRNSKKLQQQINYEEKQYKRNRNRNRFPIT